MGTLAAAVVALLRRSVEPAMADRGRTQGIASRNGSRPGHANRRENLHGKRDQDDREKLLKALTHVANHPGSHHMAAGNSGRDRESALPLMSVVRRANYSGCVFWIVRGP